MDEDAQPWERIRHNARAQREAARAGAEAAFSHFWAEAGGLWRKVQGTATAPKPRPASLEAERAELEAQLVHETLKRKELERDFALLQRKGQGQRRGR